MASSKPSKKIRENLVFGKKQHSGEKYLSLVAHIITFTCSCTSIIGLKKIQQNKPTKYNITFDIEEENYACGKKKIMHVGSICIRADLHMCMGMNNKKGSMECLSE